MDVARILEILRECEGDVEGTNGCEIIDVMGAQVPLLVAKVHEHAPEMIELLKEWPDISWGHPVPALGEDINY